LIYVSKLVERHKPELPPVPASEGVPFGVREDENMLGTLAAAYAEVGDFDKAVEWQEKANKHYTDADDRRKGEDRLKLYKKKKPYQETE